MKEMLLELNVQSHVLQRVSYHYQHSDNYLKDDGDTYKPPENSEKHTCFMSDECKLINCC